MIKMKKNRFVLLIVGVVIGTLLTASAGFYFFTSIRDVTLVSKSDYETLSEMGNKYAKLYSMQKTINEQFLWEVDEEAQMDAIYKAAIDSLGDKYSSYMTQEEYEQWSNYVMGTFTGVGVVFSEDKNGNFVINRVVEGGPADSAGMKAGDILLKVDGRAYSDSTKMAMAMRGEEGTNVTITYQRDNKVKKAELVRAKVEEPSVYSTILNQKYGYIQITAFEKTTAEQFKTELAEMENKNLKGLIIDLRENPGGFVDQGIEIADMLLPECTITHTENKQGEKEYYNSDEHCTKLKYVVLVNENTASSSEIIAAAIKDNKGGKIVGTTTFGKGIIQGSMEFEDKSAMKLTIMQYFSPKDNKIHGVGVKPDYVVKLSKNAKTDTQLKKALELLK